MPPGRLHLGRRHRRAACARRSSCSGRRCGRWSSASRCRARSRRSSRRTRCSACSATTGPAAVARASGFGMVSSSCSYAASAMAKSLFQKGADFISAMVFMFASTNLVVELGIVLLVLDGLAVRAAEFVGGPIMIVLLALVGGSCSAAARQRARAAARGARRPRPRRDGRRQRGAQASSNATPWREKLTSEGGVVRRRELHDGRHHDAPQGARDRLRRRRVPHRARADARLERRVHRTATVLDEPRERASSVRSSRSSASSARSATCRWPPRCGTAASASAA